MTSIEEMQKMVTDNVDTLDLTPFTEPIEFKVEEFGTGFRAVTKIHINYRWGVATEWLESARIFGHKAQIDEDEFKIECLKCIRDINEKRLWVFEANHGLRDRNEGTFAGMVRFKA